MSDEHYYEIYVSACGFLNRLQTIEHRNGQASLVCSFAALRGEKGKRENPTYFDAKVVGDQTKALLSLHRDAINDKTRQVFVSVRLSDLYVKPFIRQKGERKGESGFSLKTRLLVVESLAIDGVVVYRRSDDPTVELASRRNRQDAQQEPENDREPETPSRQRAGAARPAAASRSTRTGMARA